MTNGGPGGAQTAPDGTLGTAQPVPERAAETPSASAAAPTAEGGEAAPPATGAAPENAPASATAPESTPAPSPQAAPAAGKLNLWLEGSALFGVLGVSLGHFLWAALSPELMLAYVTQNQLATVQRAKLLGTMASGGAVVLAAAWIGFWLVKGGSLERLRRAAVRLSPGALIGVVPLLFNWALWRGNELTGLVLLAVSALLLELAVRRSLETGPAVLPARAVNRLHRATARVRAVLDRPHAPLVAVGLGALGYAVFFSVFTLRVHARFDTLAFDLGIENNLVWNASHLGPLFKSSPLGDANAVHTGYHQTFFSYLIALPYRLWPTPQFMLVLQSVFIAAAAVPLFLWAKARISPWMAALVAVGYLAWPPVHGANLYDFHYQPLSPFFLWTTLLLLERRRDGWAALTAVLTLSLREDMGLLLVIMGGLLVLLRERPRAGLVLAAAGFTVFVVQKGIVMPRFLDGVEAYSNQYQDLIPQGDKGFGGVLKTVGGNPGFTLSSLLVPLKLPYVLQVFAPLVFLPLRRAIGWWLILPGFFFTLLSTHYDALVQISFQYTAYWTMGVFPAVVLALQAAPPVPRRARLAALVFAMAAATYVWGGVFQQNIVRGAWKLRRFAVLDVDKQRRADFDALAAQVPPDARVALSEYLNPQLSSRENCYALRGSIHDAEWVLFEPARLYDFERSTLRPPLQQGVIGVVETRGDFVLAKRGADTKDNAAVLARVH